ncbi:MAG TPA: hypothetical protein VFQ59_00920 [Candidatus Paceibacterota bacterium]|nr:hypothetical protein [Candidatus Paceibacterota bacterium]
MPKMFYIPFGGDGFPSSMSQEDKMEILEKSESPGRGEDEICMYYKGAGLPMPQEQVDVPEEEAEKLIKQREDYLSKHMSNH